MHILHLQLSSLVLDKLRFPRLPLMVVEKRVAEKVGAWLGRRGDLHKGWGCCNLREGAARSERGARPVGQRGKGRRVLGGEVIVWQIARPPRRVIYGQGVLFLIHISPLSCCIIIFIRRFIIRRDTGNEPNRDKLWIHSTIEPISNFSSEAIPDNFR